MGVGPRLFGIFIGFGVIGHYMHGAQHPTGQEFLHNVSLWFGCPWTLSVYAIQLGSLGMVVFGTLCWVLGRSVPEARVQPAGSAAFWLCVVGLIGIFATGYVGYFVADALWPEFYYKPVEAGKNAWLLAQLACVACYFAGAILARRTIRSLLRSQ